MKSHASDLLKVALSIYLDACSACIAEVSERDLTTIRSRFEDEGVSFLTITLPAFAADFEKSLELGQVDSLSFRNFRKNKAIPAFLQGMLSHVFNLETGRINDVKDFTSPDDYVRLVASVRQICLAFKKIELPCTPEREYKALENFIEIENSFKVRSVPREDVERFALVSSVLWDDVMGNLCLDDVIPRHGPGATSERVAGNRKYAWKFWHERLEPYLPLIDSGFPISCGELPFRGSELESVEFRQEDSELPVRVTPVPKTLKGPRIIAIEPCCMQYAQQGLRGLLYSTIESHWCAKGRINFRDQVTNQSLAMKSSYDGRSATIDLSDASDRVPRDLALEMFRGNPALQGFIDACRSRYAEMPDGRLIGPLAKFASMGSALCFPVEAMYFYTICVVAALEKHNLPVSRRAIKRVSRGIYVYGDDIIVPSYMAITVLDHLKKYNCKVNERKTFYRGNFRESCGVDGFYGQPVRPVYIGTVLPSDRRQSREFVSSVATANQFFKAGYKLTSAFLLDRVEKVFGRLPSVPEDSFVIGRTHSWWSDPKLKKRWNSDLQHFEIRCWVPAPSYYTDEVDGYAALQKCLLRLHSKTVEPYRTRSTNSIDQYVDYIDYLASNDVKHLVRSARHGVVTTKLRWVPAQMLA
jgi:hypothetical protein